MVSGLQLRNLSYRVGTFRLDDVTLQVEPGQYVVLAGPNGAGKTMLIRLVAGLLRPVGGQIVLNGDDLTDTPPWARNLGYVPQDAMLMPHLRVEENIAFGLQMRHVPRRQRRRQAADIAARLGIADLLARRPAGLSGGERQKVSLARALVLQPAALLLEEPVSAFDEAARDAACDDLRRLQRELGIPALHVAHNRAEIDRVADRVALLRGGRLVFWGGLDDLPSAAAADEAG